MKADVHDVDKSLCRVSYHHDTNAEDDFYEGINVGRQRKVTFYRVGQIKRGHCAFLLVTNECIYQNL